MKSVENWHTVSEKKTFKDYKILFMYKPRGKGRYPKGDKMFDCNYQILLL